MVQVRDSRSAPPLEVVALTGVTKVYPGRVAVRALDGVTVGFGRGSFTAVMGASGSGKSTLLHCAAGLDRPTHGRVVLAGQAAARHGRGGRGAARRDRVGRHDRHPGGGR